MGTSIVRESLEFRRGQNSKRSLGVGRWHDHPEIMAFDELAKSRGYEDVTPSDYPLKASRSGGMDSGITYLAIYENPDTHVGLKVFVRDRSKTSPTRSLYAVYAYNKETGEFGFVKNIEEYFDGDYYWDYAKTMVGKK